MFLSQHLPLRVGSGNSLTFLGIVLTHSLSERLYHFEVLIHAFIMTCSDCCSVDAQLLTGAKKREHIAPILASLHPLSLHLRVDFKILLFLFIFMGCPLRVSCPTCSSLTLPLTGRQIVVVRPHHKKENIKLAMLFAPEMWKELPLHIREAD